MMSYKDNYNNYKLLEEFIHFLPEKYHFRIHTIFHLKVSKTWNFYRRNNDLHLIDIKSGQGIYRLEGKEDILDKGRTIFVSANFLHGGSVKGNDPPFITPVRFGLYDNKTGKQVPFPLEPFCISTQSSTNLYHQLFENLYQSFLLPREKNRNILCNSIVQQIFVSLLNEQQQDSQIDSRIEKVKKQIIDDPITRWTPEQLAEIAEISPKYFSRLFKQQIGHSPIDFCIFTRCQHAEFLLQNSNRSVKDIALSLGYPDQYAFSKQYKKVIGHPPSQR